MKTNKWILALAALALLACNKEEKNETPVAEAGDYKGVVTVEASSGMFDNEDIEVNFTPSEDGASATITINKIRFVPQMPVTIDVTIPNVEVTSTKNGFQLACDNVIPLAMGGEYERYTVTNLTGTLKDDELAFSLNFGSTPTSFKGTKQAK
jgi:hypothetical protein